MKAVLLCAGLGTRLRPLTDRWPKCAIPLLGQPLFRYNLATLKLAGVTELGVNTHYLPEEMEQVAREECERAGVSLWTSREDELQGTGGGLRGFKGLLREEPFVVLNGDVLFAVDLAPLFGAHVKAGRIATMVLTPMPAGEKFAPVEVDAEGRVRRIAGRGPVGAALTPYHFASVQFLSPAIFDFMSPSGPEEIFTDVYARMWAKGVDVHATVVEGTYWSDLGTPVRYLNAAIDWISGGVPSVRFPGASPLLGKSEIAPGVWAAPGARCDVFPDGPAILDAGAVIESGAQIRGPVFLGRDTLVSSGATVERSVVFEGTRVAPGETLCATIAWGSHRLAVQGSGQPAR